MVFLILSCLYNSVEMDKKDLFKELKAEVLGRQKILAKVCRQRQNSSVFDYANDWPLSGGIDKAAAEIIRNCLQGIYGTAVAGQAAEQLQTIPLVSTIDHHGILNHSFFVNSNLIFSLRKSLSFLICFSTAGVSLNNSSWPGCLVFTDSATGQLKRFSFFPDRQKTCTVLAAPALTEAGVNAVLARIGRDKILKPEQKEKLLGLVKETVMRQEVLSLPSFSGQASLISTGLWQKIFPQASGVVYLPVEDVVSRLITEKISRDKNHALYKLFFSPPGWQLVEKYFQGSLGAFSAFHKGSFLFWAVNDKGRRVHLHRQGQKLRDHDFAVELNPEAVSAALAKKDIYPTSLVCFLVLLYYRITCLGGFNQVNWLTDIKNKFVSLLGEMGEANLAKSIAGAVTDNFAEGNLAFLLRDNKLIKATGIDLFLSGDKQLFEKYRQLSRLMTVGESIESLLPEIYRVIIPERERKKGLLSLTGEEIVKNSGLEEKIRRVLAG